MRLTFLLAAAALALPAATLADVPSQAGQLVPGTSEDQYFNADECKGTGDVKVSWSLAGAVLQSGVVRVYASNTQPVQATGAAFATCEIQDKAATSPIYAGQIDPPGDLIADATFVNRQDQTLNIGKIMAAATTGDAATYCAASTTTVYVCAHFYPYLTGTTTPASSPSAAAWGSFILNTAKPSAPKDLTLKVGDTRLYASWNAGSGGAAVNDYQVIATKAGDTSPTRTKTCAVTNCKVDGLTNDVEYAIVVKARSVSGTLSDASSSQSAIPRHVKDFWEVYDEQGGPETGGCGGPAGPLALAGVAALLVVGRPGRRS
ncbi:MAG: fibronectin type III domain-containing protein [Anaeromyxobacteraceae bacterium]